jgi:hypothetical protein
MAGTRDGTATRVPVRLALQMLVAAGSIGAQIGREAAREGTAWVLETRRRHRVINGDLPGLVSVLGDTPGTH